ncbi:MAG: acyltransferase family protein [Sarcina sp.]
MEIKIKQSYNYKFLNVIKFIAAILVVMIHTMALKSLNEDLWIVSSLGICRVAVPFFFIISGYFFYNLNTKEQRINKIKKYTVFYFKALIIEAILLIPFILMVIKNAGIVIFIKNLIFLGVTGSLWYISSMVIGLLFILPFLKKNNLKLLATFSIIFFLFGLIGDSYYGLFKDSFLNNAILSYKFIFGMMQVGVTASVPFLTLGIFINKFKLIEKVKKPLLYLILASILLIIETFMLTKNNIAIDNNLYISLLVVAPMLFIFTIKSKIKIKDENSQLFRKLSVFVYILHQPIMLILGYVGLFNGNTLFKFIVTITVTIIISLFLIKIKFSEFLKV